MYSIKGIVKVVGEVNQISDKFKKRDIVITDNSSKYPQDVSFQLTQDKVDLANSLSVGSEITANFNLRGREWTSPKGEVKYFNTLEIWKVETSTQNDAPVDNQDNSDLPF